MPQNLFFGHFRKQTTLRRKKNDLSHPKLRCKTRRNASSDADQKRAILVSICAFYGKGSRGRPMPLVLCIVQAVRKNSDGAKNLLISGLRPHSDCPHRSLPLHVEAPQANPPLTRHTPPCIDRDGAHPRWRNTARTPHTPTHPRTAHRAPRTAYRVPTHPRTHAPCTRAPMPHAPATAYLCTTLLRTHAPRTAHLCPTRSRTCENNRNGSMGKVLAACRKPAISLIH